MNDKHIHTHKFFYNRRRDLRKNLTLEEVLLWIQLKGSKLGVKFQRQHSIGYYIVDFYCAKKRLIIEIDGAQHLENREYDNERTAYFTSLDYKVIRFWNSDVRKNMDAVLRKIKGEIS